MNWIETIAGVVAGRSPADLARMAGVSDTSVTRWLAGQRVPSAVHWRALVVGCGADGRWAALSAARDAAEKRRGRPRLSREEGLRRKARRILDQLAAVRMERAAMTQGAPAPEEV